MHSNSVSFAYILNTKTEFCMFCEFMQLIRMYTMPGEGIL